MLANYAGGPQALLTARIPVSEPLLSGFQRRGRRKIREIEEGIPDCQVKFVKGDSPFLAVTGSLEAIELVRHKVECMTGPKKELSMAAWAEMMRTRTCHDQCSIVAQIQQASGCRLHIERSQFEVRLFGPEQVVARADRMVDHLEAACTATHVDAAVSSFDSMILSRVAEEMGVSIRVSDDSKIWIMGFKVLVELTKPLIERYIWKQIDPVVDMEAEPLVEEAVRECCELPGELSLGDRSCQPKSLSTLLASHALLASGSPGRGGPVGDQTEALPKGQPMPAHAVNSTPFENFFSNPPPLEQVLGEVRREQMCQMPAAAARTFPLQSVAYNEATAIGETVLKIEALKIEMQRMKLLEQQLLQQAVAFPSPTAQPPWSSMPSRGPFGYAAGAR